MMLRICGLALPLAVAIATTALAEGAVALGRPASIVRDGVAFGWSVGHATPGEAERRALEECHRNPDAPDHTRRLCIVIQNFRNQCVAGALDPDSGTPGFGWAIADTLKVAGERALAMCRNSSPPGRRDFCRIASTGCDGAAK
jgi:hypothetical protein